MLAYAGTYHIDDVINAIKFADSYRQKTESTGATVYIDMLVDAELAITQAGLTEKQREIIELLWGYGYTQKQVSQMLGISQVAVSQREQAAKKRVQEVLSNWKSKN